MKGGCRRRVEEEIQVNKTYKELPTGKRKTKNEWFLGRQVEKVNKGQGVLYSHAKCYW